MEFVKPVRDGCGVTATRGDEGSSKQKQRHGSLDSEAVEFVEPVRDWCGVTAIGEISI